MDPKQIFNPQNLKNPAASLEMLGNSREKIIALAKTYGLSFLYGLAILFVGMWVINRIKTKLKQILISRGYQTAAVNYAINFISFLLKLMLTIGFFSTIGIETTSFVAVLGAASLAVGLALQGNLANFAGGIILLLFKPFRVGDTIVCKDVEGEVIEVQTFHTILTTSDGRRVICPNGEISNSILHNLSIEKKRRVDIGVCVSPMSDIAEIKKIVFLLMQDHPLVLKNLQNEVWIKKIQSFEVVLEIRVWCLSKDTAVVTSEFNEKILMHLQKNGNVSTAPLAWGTQGKV